MSKQQALDTLIHIDDDTPPRFTIGTKYSTRGKHARECEVVDIHFTFNSAGDSIKYRYVSRHLFLGQYVYDYDVCDTTIARGLLGLQDIYIYTRE